MEFARPVSSIPRQVTGLGAWLLLVFIAAGIGAIGSADAPSFYARLTRPAWAPPASWFGPVWTVLYALMGIAAWRVWRRRGFAGARPALVLFVVQLAVNALWSWLFFAWHQGALAFADIVLLVGLIVATMIAFWKLDRVSALLLLPYLAWVSFASALSFWVWRLNPQLL